MRERTDGKENRKKSADKNKKQNKDQGTRDTFKDKKKEENRILPVSFIKTGKDIVKSVLFWCVAVSAVVSVCRAAGDAVISLRSRGTERTELPAENSPSEGTELSAENRSAEGAELSAENGSAERTELPVENRSSEGAELPAENSSAEGTEPPARIQTVAAAGNQNVETAEPEKKTVALTFDDGPHPVYTKKLLDGLLERGVKATFFVIGENIPGNEDLIARMEEEGHLIGNHTYDHVKICDMKEEDACYQVEQTSALVREITGHDTEFVRPPFGAWNPELECSFVMIPVLWDVDPLDWTTSNTSLVVQRVVEDADDQDIILLHDFYESSVDAALQIVDILKNEGFEFVTVDKLILP